MLLLRCLGGLTAFAALLCSQTNANYDEAKAGTYTLPDPLRFADGRPVLTGKEWMEKRRPEVIRLFEENQFGRSPGRPEGMHFDVTEKGTPAFSGKAIRKQITIYFAPGETGPKMDLLMYLPARTATPAPVLLNISFTANSATVDDPAVKEGLVWGKNKTRVPAKEAFQFPKMNIVPWLDAGFGFATVYYGDIEPDFEGGLQYGVRSLYIKPGQASAADDWGAIAAWGWGLSRVLDYFQTEPKVDSSRVCLFGASRLGKAALWAGAGDTRFAAVIACCSGEGGASISRRDFGETVANLNAHFPYWFCANYAKFAHHVDQLPVDANMLLALLAPRPLLLQTGDKDLWGDPKGEFLAEVGAGPVYRLLGKQDLGTDVWPPAGTPILHTLGYYMHAGGHGPLPADWSIFLDFLRMHLQS
jgi:hypothetical protein